MRHNRLLRSQNDRPAFERRLKKVGCQVTAYPSAQQLLDHLPDDGGGGCILLDVRIPGLTGPQLQRRLAELGSTLPIIFSLGLLGCPTTIGGDEVRVYCLPDQAVCGDVTH